MTDYANTLAEGIMVGVGAVEPILRRRRPCMVGVFGASQAGKTRYANEMSNELEAHGRRVAVIAMGGYYLTKQQLAARYPEQPVNFDVPDAVDLEALARDLEALRENATTATRASVYERDTASDGFPSARVIMDGRLDGGELDIVITEGLFVHHPPVRAKLDLLVFCQQPDTRKRLANRLRRDVEERGYDAEVALERWGNQVEPGHHEHVAPSGFEERFNVDLWVKNPY